MSHGRSAPWRRGGLVKACMGYSNVRGPGCSDRAARRTRPALAPTARWRTVGLTRPLLKDGVRRPEPVRGHTPSVPAILDPETRNANCVVNEVRTQDRKTCGCRVDCLADPVALDADDRHDCRCSGRPRRGPGRCPGASHFKETGHKSAQVSDTLTVPVKPGWSSWVTYQAPVFKTTGDFTVKIGGNTWKITDVTFDIPQPDEQKSGTLAVKQPAHRRPGRPDGDLRPAGRLS